MIFSGSDGKGRAGFAEVSLLFDNTDRLFPLETSEVVIARRLNRDGESEYRVNGTRTRLQDIQLMLAQAGVGQRSYSVVGQGMIDAVLVSSPEERKQFFDDATGVKPFQIKRHQAMLKLKRTYENLAETEMVLREIHPRLRLLKKQVRRLEEREEIEKELRGLQHTYYGTLWHNLRSELNEVQAQFNTHNQKVHSHRAEVEKLEKTVGKMEEAERKEGTQDAGLLNLQETYRAKEAERRTVRDQEFHIQKEIELSRVRAQSNWAPLPLIDIVKELDEMVSIQQTSLKALKSIREISALAPLVAQIEQLFLRSEKLQKQLKRPAPEDVKPDPKLLKELGSFQTSLKKIEEELAKINKDINSYAKTEQERRSELFEIERSLRDTQRTLHEMTQKLNEVQIVLARLTEREEHLNREMEHELRARVKDVKQSKPKTLLSDTEVTTVRDRIDQLKYKMDLIGGIDPEIVAEYKETQERFDHLDTQVRDLKAAMKDTEHLVDELDERIRKQSEKAFKEINKEFQRYFKILFGGGACSLVKLTKKDLPVPASEETLHESDVNPALGKMDPDALEELEQRVKERSDRVVGIDITATPPSKKLKALNLLSGGERALTSIALLAAIMATNPSPFVVLDEVDAALDEANTLRFAEILEELREKTQYIVVTHNRATMEKADVLYGVTMGEDGVSQLLSVRLDEIASNGTTRR